MMMAFNFVISLILAHFVSDWILQSRAIAEAKSKNLFLCLFHGWVNGLFLFTAVGINALYGVSINWAQNAFWFLLFYTSCHTLQDWFVWRGYARIRGPKLTDDKPFYKDYWFYTTIAIDQIVHLVIIFYLAFKVII